MFRSAPFILLGMIITIVSHRNQLGLRINWLHYFEANPFKNLLRGSIGWKKTGEVAELAEGGRLLSDCRGKTSTAGSNPALSAHLGWLTLINAWQIIHEQVRGKKVPPLFFPLWRSVSKRWEEYINILLFSSPNFPVCCKKAVHNVLQHVRISKFCPLRLWEISF